MRRQVAAQAHVPLNPGQRDHEYTQGGLMDLARTLSAGH
jgi:hypothetical protein